MKASAVPRLCSSISLDGGADDDVLTGGDGVDALDGGGGTNQARFDTGGETAGAVVDLVKKVATNDGFGNADTLENIQNVAGSALGDTLIYSSSLR